MLNLKSILVLSAAVFLFSGCFESGDKKAAAGRQMQPSHVDIFVAQKADVPISFDYTATVTSNQDVIIYPKVSGTIIKQFFKPGDKVKAGDKLFLIDPEKYEASYDSLDAAVGVANANLKNAQTEFKRISALYKKNAVSQKDYDAAVAAYDIANANLVSAKANLKNAKIDLGYTNIVAPFDGVVGDNKVDVGSLVVASQTQLVRLTKINPIEADFYIADVDNLSRKANLDNGAWQQLNSEAVLNLNNENFTGKVTFIDNVVNTATGSVLAKASFDNSEGTRKVTTRMAVYFYGCITMDGYLADSQHRIDWLHQLGSIEDTGYDDFYRQMDITIMGKRTFEEIQDLQDVESFYQATENYVFTHDRHLPVSNYQPVAGDVVDFVHQIDKGKNVFVIGGNSLVGPLLDADLFDHLIIQIAPLILGKGVPLFTQEEGQRFYQLDSLRQFGPFAELVFSRKSQK